MMQSVIELLSNSDSIEYTHQKNVNIQKTENNKQAIRKEKLIILKAEQKQPSKY